jgi:hypothetical protein
MTVLDGPAVGATPRSLRYGEWAVALYASDVPYPASDGIEGTAVASDEQALDCFVAQGVRRLGGVSMVHALHKTWLDLNEQFLDGRLHGSAYEQAIRDLWPDGNRLERCLACDFKRLR